MRLRFLYIALFTIVSFFSIGQNFNFQFQHLGSDKGWTKPIIYDTYQDDDGFIWAATTAGLIKFNGYETKVFYHNPNNFNSLNSNYVKGVDYYSDNELWICTSLGSCIINRHSNEIRKVSADSNAVVNSIYSQSFHKDTKGRNWIATTSGPAIYHSESDSLEIFKLKSRDGEDLEKFNVRCLIETSNGDIWMGSGGHGAYKLVGEEFVCYFSEDDPVTHSNGQVFAFHEELFGVEASLEAYTIWILN